MAPKRKEHSNKVRSLIIKHYQNGDSQREIASNMLVPRETVRYIIQKNKDEMYRQFIQMWSQKKN